MIFGELLTVFPIKVNLLYLLYFSQPGGLYSVPYKVKLFAKNFLRTGVLITHVSLPAFPFRTNLKLHNIYATVKLAKKVIINYDLPKASGPDCIPVVA